MGNPLVKRVGDSLNTDAAQGAFDHLTDGERESVLRLFADWADESSAEGFDRVGRFVEAVLGLLSGAQREAAQRDTV